MNAIEHIRLRIEQDLFDSVQLMHCLANYRKPRDVISLLIKKGQIIRIRKGLFCFGELWQRNPISREMLANLIYGPSVISLDYALSFYGFIPEQVSGITSVTTGRSKSFNTPLGNFYYTHLSISRFAFGNTINQSSGKNWLIAEPIKALADKTWTDKRFTPTSPASFADYFFKDLRIDEHLLTDLLRGNNLADLSEKYNTRKIAWMVEFLQKYFK